MKYYKENISRCPKLQNLLEINKVSNIGIGICKGAMVPLDKKFLSKEVPPTEQFEGLMLSSMPDIHQACSK